MNDPTSDALNQLDTENFKKEIKEEAVKEAQDALIQRLQGDKDGFEWEKRGKKAPSDYNEMFAESDRRADEKLENFKQELEKEKVEKAEAETKLQEDSRKVKAEELENKRKGFDNEWSDLVKQGKMKDATKESWEKINKGEKLTKEEIDADEGLKARLELAALSQSTGKSAKLVFYEDYKQEPAGAKAPVLGGRPRTPQKESTELEYKDVAANRKRLYGF